MACSAYTYTLHAMYVCPLDVYILCVLLYDVFTSPCVHTMCTYYVLYIRCVHTIVCMCALSTCTYYNDGFRGAVP